MRRPLEGIRVLDLSRVLSGPHCGRMLADMGADVIKLEPPAGDATRTAQPRTAGLSVYFTQQNCGKRNVSIDLQQPRGAGIGLELAAACDVVLENFRPGVMDRLGLGYEAIHARNPRIVYCSITGYGSQGPASQRRAYAGVTHAEVGYMELAARKRETHPMPEVVSHADLYAGMQAAFGIMTALYNRERTGHGERVDVSMAETLLQANEWTATDIATDGAELTHAFGGYNAPVLQLADGSWACVSGDPVTLFASWTRAMQRPDLAEDERFATPQARTENRAEIMRLLQEWAAGIEGFEQLERILDDARLASGMVQSLSQAAQSDWATERQAFVAIDDRAGGTVQLPRSPLRFDALDAGARGVAAYRGEHNAEVLAELLGLSEETIEQLTSEGVLSSRIPSEAQPAREER